MNPLTQIKNTQKASRREWALGLTEGASWHARFNHSAYVFAGGLNYDLTEGDLLAVFAQYGEVVDMNLVRDRETGRSRGFAFLAYEDQRSTILAVDNLSGARVAGRIIRVEHVDQYKMKQKEPPQEVAEEEGQWGKKPSRGADDAGRWQHDKFEELQKESGEGHERWLGGAAASNGAQQRGSMFEMMHEHLQETAKKMAEDAHARKVEKPRTEEKRKRESNELQPPLPPPKKQQNWETDEMGKLRTAIGARNTHGHKQREDKGSGMREMGKNRVKPDYKGFSERWQSGVEAEAGSGWKTEYHGPLRGVEGESRERGDRHSMRGFDRHPDRKSDADRRGRTYRVDTKEDTGRWGEGGKHDAAEEVGKQQHGSDERTDLKREGRRCDGQDRGRDSREYKSRRRGQHSSSADRDRPGSHEKSRGSRRDKTRGRV